MSNFKIHGGLAFLTPSNARDFNCISLAQNVENQSLKLGLSPYTTGAVFVCQGSCRYWGGCVSEVTWG